MKLQTDRLCFKSILDESAANIEAALMLNVGAAYSRPPIYYVPPHSR